MRQVCWLCCSLLPGFLIDVTFCFFSVLDRCCSWTLWSITCLLTLTLETSGQDVIPMGWSCSTMILKILLHLRCLSGDITVSWLCLCQKPVLFKSCWYNLTAFHRKCLAQIVFVKAKTKLASALKWKPEQHILTNKHPLRSLGNN